jgi:hypothetical protein
MTASLVSDGKRLHWSDCPAIAPEAEVVPAVWAYGRELNDVIRECITGKDTVRPCLRCLTIYRAEPSATPYAYVRATGCALPPVSCLPMVYVYRGRVFCTDPLTNLTWGLVRDRKGRRRFVKQKRPPAEGNALKAVLDPTGKIRYFAPDAKGGLTEYHPESGKFTATDFPLACAPDIADVVWDRGSDGEPRILVKRYLGGVV